MIEYGRGPAHDEIEVSLFGPGYGEAIAVHLGEDNWMLVDSCIDPESKKPASLTYLERIGVQKEQVRVIIASHWHDDHCRGLSRLVDAFPSAELQISSVFSNKEAQAFLAAYNNNVVPKLARGTRELYQSVVGRNVTYPLQQRSNILELPLAQSEQQVRAVAFSPVPAAVAQFVARVASYIPTDGPEQPIGHAPDLHPNNEAVVVHIDWGNEAILLGADLEQHPTLGWSAIVTDQWCTTKTASSLYKVAHHGSVSGDIPEIWTSLLQQSPVACVTPFSLGGQRLPTDEDRQRVRACTQHAYITSNATRKPDMESEKLKRLADICSGLSKVNAGFGVLRLRKKFSDTEWRVELFGNAQRL